MANRNLNRTYVLVGLYPAIHSQRRSVDFPLYLSFLLAQLKKKENERGKEADLVFVKGWGLDQSDYREGWPLLTVKTEVNGDPKFTNERGPFLDGSSGVLCWILFCLGCASRRVHYIFSSPYTISMSLSPIAQQAGQAVVLGRLSLSVCLWVGPSETTSKQKVWPLPILFPQQLSIAGILEQSMGAKKRDGKGLSYRPAWLHRLAESIPRNRFLGFLKVLKDRLCFRIRSTVIKWRNEYLTARPSLLLLNILRSFTTARSLQISSTTSPQGCSRIRLHY
jgi:hypothetical protein